MKYDQFMIRSNLQKGEKLCRKERRGEIPLQTFSLMQHEKQYTSGFCKIRITSKQNSSYSYQSLLLLIMANIISVAQKT